MAVLLASACTKNETPPPDDAKTTATDKTGAAQDSAGEHAKGPASGSSGDVTQAGLPQLPAAGSINVPTRSGDEEILGHVSVPNGARMMQNVKDHFAVPSISGFLDEQALRNIGASMLGARRDIAFNLDISKPFGCAVVDIKTYSDGPVACTFAYKGGAAQLVKDLGDGGQKPDAGGHTAIYTIEGKDVYVDALGESVVVSLYDPLFKLTSGYLQRNIVERQTAGDIELALYLNYAWDKYGADIKGLLDMAKAMQGSTPEIGVPELDQALAKFQDASDAMTNKNLERLADYEVGVLQLGASPDSVWMDFSFAVKPGTQSAKDAAEYGGRVVDRALLEATPNDAVAFIGWSTDLRAADTPTAAEARQALMVAWSSLTGHSAADGEAAVKAFLAEMQTMYTGDGAMALVHHHGTPVAIYMSQKLKAGSGRDAWKAWSQKFTPDAVLGARGAKFVTWSFTPDAGKAGPAAIDRWVIEPTPQAIDEMKLTPEKKAEIEKWIGGLKVTIDRTEAAGHVIWTIAPKAEDAFAARAVAAHNGTGSLKGDAALGKLLSIYPDAATVGGVDVRKGVEWLRSFPELAEEIQLSTPLGVNLADAHLAGVYGKDGRFQARLGISQGFVDQLRALGGK
ncbi:MAG: hypothetical protein KC468_11970 [Myxococcales bacterium]|nr:hypothetical protein [Myxococcales bacterium]